MKPEKIRYINLLVFLLCFGPSRVGSAAHLFSAFFSRHLFCGSFAASTAKGHGHRILSFHRAIYTTYSLSLCAMHSGMYTDENRLNKVRTFSIDNAQRCA